MKHKAYYAAVIFTFLIAHQTASANTVSWEQKADIPVERGMPAVASVNGEIYVLGGDSYRLLAYQYSPTTNTWIEKTPPPENGLREANAVAIGSKIYSFGNPFDKDVKIYDTTSDSWETGPALDTPYYRAVGLATVNGKIYFIGGADGGLNATTRVLEYDPSRASFTTKADMPLATAYAATAVLGDKIYVIGGRSSTSGILDAVQEYDTQADSWQLKSNILTPRSSVSGGTVEGKIYVFGGFDGSAQLASVEEYDPSSNSWKYVSEMPVARSFMGSTIVGSDVYIFGGHTPDREFTDRTDVAHIRPTSKAIIIGTAPVPTDAAAVSNAFYANTTLAYQALRLQGYGDDEILFLSSDSPTDLDGDGEIDVDDLATKANLENAVREWAADASDLTLYLVGHGGNGTFRVGKDEILQAEELDQWLDEYQNKTEGKVVFVYDACESGSFLPILIPPAGTQRIVITSTQSDTPAFMQGDGVVSFSYYFWSQVMMGATVEFAFTTALNSLDVQAIRQVPQIDANGNGINDKGEATQLADLYIGDGVVHAGDRPIIGTTFGTLVLKRDTSATLWVDGVTTTGEISRVWATITPPGYHPDDPTTVITDLTTIDLHALGNGYYEGTYDGFVQRGVYNVVFYAQDTDGVVSMPQAGTVIKSTGGRCVRSGFCR